MDLLVDTHCHLYFDSFDKDRSEVLLRAKKSGVERILVPGINVETSRLAIDLAERYEDIYAAVGVHPNDGQSWKNDTLRTLQELAEHPKVVAIGEIGLDYYRDSTQPELQRKVFEEQLSLAADCGLPVVIHNRQATSDVLEILENWHIELTNKHSPLVFRPGVLHSYSGDSASSQHGMSLNFFLGITGPITFKNAFDLQKIVGKIPVNRILVETDAPFLTPHPHRGKRNEPANVKFVADKIAEIHNLSSNTVARQTTDNAGRLFNW